MSADVSFCRDTAAIHVLIVDDEKKLRESLVEGLRLEDWAVTAAANGADALVLVDAVAFDLIVLDWMLPDYEGTHILRYVRSLGLQTPVLMVTARDSLADRVAGFDNGTDDYVVKPFAFSELLARCRALLRRSVPAPTRLEYRDLVFDVRARAARRGGVEVSLTPIEVDVLEYFMRNQGKVVTREMLATAVWSETRPNFSLGNAINIHVARLRQKIDGGAGSAERLIHTVHGLGYRFGPALGG
jgi:DNA-binding response OmpR family regulator